jgi:hypothetical protein
MSDPNFRLCILQALLENGRLTTERLHDFLNEKVPELKPAPGVYYDGEEEEGEVAKATIAALATYPLTADDWNSIEEIQVDGGDEIYFVVENHLNIETGGESDFYLYRSAAEAEQCPNLKALDVSIYYSGSDPDDVLERLRARGVDVTT